MTNEEMNRSQENLELYIYIILVKKPEGKVAT
jgi:hypothetical protein